MSDYYSMLSRYVGHRVCLTLHGQINVWGSVASVCYDGVRVTDVTIGGDLDNPAAFGEMSEGANSSREALLHINQILAVTCDDDDLPDKVEETARTERPQLLVDPLELMLGTDLALTLEDVPHVQLKDQLDRLRAEIAGELGVLLPEARIREERRIGPEEFIVKIRGVTAASGRVETARLLAVETSDASKPLDGLRVDRFGLSGYWIERPQRELAELYHYEVLDVMGMLMVQLEAIFRERAADLFGRQQLEDLLDQVRLVAPALVDEVVPHLVRPRKLQKVLRNLLREEVSIRDLETILETLSDIAGETKDVYELTERVRQALTFALMEHLCDNGTLHVVSLDPALETSLARLVQKSPRGPQIMLTPQQRDALLAAVDEQLDELRQMRQPQTLLTTSRLRAALRSLLSARFPRCAVLSHEELDSAAEVETVGMVFDSDDFHSERRAAGESSQGRSRSRRQPNKQ